MERNVSAPNDALHLERRVSSNLSNYHKAINYMLVVAALKYRWGSIDLCDRSINDFRVQNGDNKQKSYTSKSLKTVA